MADRQSGGGGDGGSLGEAGDDVDDFVWLVTSRSKTPPSGSLSDQFSPPSNGPLDKRFCTRENLDQCVAYMNQELTVLGYPSLYDPVSETFDIVRLVNCCHELLKLQQKSRQIREDLENSQRRAESDLEHMTGCQSRLKKSMEQQSRDIGQLQEKNRQLSIKLKTLTAKIKTEKEEVERLQSVIQHRDLQYKHEKKKKEREVNKLKERVHQQLTDKSDRRIGMDILNALQRADGKRSKWNIVGNNKSEEELYRGVIRNYEEKQKELMLENSKMRDLLQQHSKHMTSLLNPQSSTSPQDQQPSPQVSSSSSSDDEEDLSDVFRASREQSNEELSDGHFQMPYEFVQDSIDKNLQRKWRLLKRHMKRLQTRKGVNGSCEGSEVLDELHTYKEQIKELQLEKQKHLEIMAFQDRLIQTSYSSPHAPEGGSQSDGGTPVIDLETERMLFEDQKAEFEAERKKFSEAAKRLGRERKSFNEEKARFLQQQFMQISPFRDKKQKSPRKMSNTSSPGIMSPDTTGPPKTPTTVDLYRTLKLVHNDDNTSNSSTNSKSAASSSRSHASRHRQRDYDKLSKSSPSFKSSLTHRNGVETASSRIEEHRENVRLALFQKSTSTGSQKNED